MFLALPLDLLNISKAVAVLHTCKACHSNSDQSQDICAPNFCLKHLAHCCWISSPGLPVLAKQSSNQPIIFATISDGVLFISKDEYCSSKNHKAVRHGTVVIIPLPRKLQQGVSLKPRVSLADRKSKFFVDLGFMKESSELCFFSCLRNRLVDRVVTRGRRRVWLSHVLSTLQGACSAGHGDL